MKLFVAIFTWIFQAASRRAFSCEPSKGREQNRVAMWKSRVKLGAPSKTFVGAEKLFPKRRELRKILAWCGDVYDLKAGELESRTCSINQSIKGSDDHCFCFWDLFRIYETSPRLWLKEWKGRDKNLPSFLPYSTILARTSLEKAERVRRSAKNQTCCAATFCAP